MNTFSLRYLYAHLGKALKQMPFEITDHNKVVAVVTIAGVNLQKDGKFVKLKNLPPRVDYKITGFNQNNEEIT